MSRFWSSLTHDLKPYVPGEQPRMANLVKLNTNENPYGPSPRVLEAIRGEASDTLRLYPDPQATALRAALADYHGVDFAQVFVGNGSDEVLAHAFVALLKHDAPLLFPDITYSFYPVYCRLFDVAYEAVPLDQVMRVRVADYRRSAGAIIVPNPNAPTGIALSRAEIAAMLEEHPDIPVVVDEAYVDFGAESAVPLVTRHDNLLVIQTLSKSRALAGLRVGFAIGQPADRGAGAGQDSFNSYPLDCFAIAGAVAAIEDDACFRRPGNVSRSRETLTVTLPSWTSGLPSQAISCCPASQPSRPISPRGCERGVLVRHFQKPRIASFPAYHDRHRRRVRPPDRPAAPDGLTAPHSADGSVAMGSSCLRGRRAPRAVILMPNAALSSRSCAIDRALRCASNAASSW